MYVTRMQRASFGLPPPQARRPRHLHIGLFRCRDSSLEQLLVQMVRALCGNTCCLNGRAATSQCALDHGYQTDLTDAETATSPTVARTPALTAISYSLVAFQP